MNNLTIFENAEFGKIRTVNENGSPMFCLADLCGILGLEQVSRVKARLKEDGVTTSKVIDSIGRYQDTTFINESNMYKVIFQSRKESAERFTDWVTSEVLPSIRNNGGYITNQENLTSEQILANAVLLAQNVIASKDKLIEQMKPKADFFDSVADSKSAVAIGEVAKVLGIRGLGRNKLFDVLRDKKILMNNNQPYQKYIDNGYFRVIEQSYMKNGEVVINFKTLVYQKGVDYIRKIVI